MKHFALLGHPLGHSISPFIHEALFSLGGRQGDYRLCPLPPEELEQGIPSLLALDGFNITIPYKQAVIPYLDRLDESAARYRSVNTAARDSQGRWVGYNTDAFGFLSALGAMGASLSGEVLLLGSGGTGKMMAVETLLAGGHLTLAVRDPESPSARGLCAFLKELFPGRPFAVTPLSQAAGRFDLLLNSTPVGMYPHPDALPVSPELAASVPFVFDAVYNPEDTRLVQAARAGGAVARSGMAMLVRQAARAQEIWLGTPFPEEQLAAITAAASRELRRLFPQ